MNKNKTRMLVEGGIMIALAYVLSMIKVYEMPNGGSVTAASMLPIIIFSIRWGIGPGIFVGGTYGLMQFLLGPKWSFHPVSILCDYILGFGVLGLAGIFGKDFFKSMAGGILVMISRLAFSVISGIVVFEVDFIGSLLYNATYMVPEIALTLIVYTIVFRPLQKFSASAVAR